MHIKVGFITPDDDKILLNYNEVLDFCKNLCLLDENISEFNIFKRNYTYFDPYFDFVMIYLKYIFINPLMEDKTYLKAIRNRFYKVKESDIEKFIDYQSISDLVIRTKNGGNYSHIVSCSDKSLNISKFSSNDITTCMIDPNGYTLISTLDEGVENHEVTSNTIINQLLINSEFLWKNYNFNQYSINYLIENFGFIRATSLKYDGLMIGVKMLFNPILIEVLNECLDKGCNFRDLQEKKDITSVVGPKLVYKIR